jgi:hypothetical protein
MYILNVCNHIIVAKNFGNKIYVKYEDNILNILIYLFNLFHVIFILKIF